MLRRLTTLLSALSLLLCVATAVVWVRSYWRMDRAALNSRRLHRAVSGGGGVFLERFDLIRRTGSWRNPAAPTTQTTEDYAAWRAVNGGSGRRWEWETEPYRGRGELIRRAWGPELNRALPQVTAVERKRREVFDNADGSLVADVLVGRRIWVPYWLLFAATAALPVARGVARARRARRSRLNLCAACGYNLTGNVSGTCPECGTPHAATAP